MKMRRIHSSNRLFATSDRWHSLRLFAPTCKIYYPCYCDLMSEKTNSNSADFNTRALEIASDLSSIGSPDHGGKQGEAWAEARAAYIRRLFEILSQPQPPSSSQS
jgi:hypothetical protein